MVTALAFVAGLIVGGFLTAWVLLMFTVLAIRSEKRQRDELAQQQRGGFRHA